MCMNGSRTIDSLLSEEASDQTTGLFPSRVFHSASIKPLYPIKVNGIMSRPRPFRGVLREEHSRQVFLFVWSGIKSLCVCERLLYIIHADTAIIGTTKPCVVCLAVVVCRYKQVTRSFYQNSVGPATRPAQTCCAIPWWSYTAPDPTSPPNPSAAGSQRQNLLCRQIPRSCYLMLPCVSSCSHKSVGLKCNGAKNVIRLAANIIWDSDDPFTRTDLMPP